ncbi:protease modulator HflC [Bullifex porci]|uniref:Protein HflC n=1 Tax=Bullifex porci TaxID=2606638 RepID=A0A7X2PBM4_9SPIO|nr:protease modulator HflC [Bullifex porci]MDD7255351.1 protease modulator HflC [Bullifex porci]MDD7588113.1 protease modulator HflC [Bullifex porci]MDY2740202.1 protease modulator HflC [Bullifex porci]MSU05925.1 protease modulator HflC [Bullifex porci]
MKKLITTLVVLAVLLIVFLMLGPFYILEEGEQAIVTRFGKIVDYQTESGLKFKMPVVDNVTKYTKKLLSWDGDAQRIPTKENQFIWVDATARWYISDVALFYETVGTIESGLGRLNDVIDSTIRTVISENYLNEAVRSSNQINLITVKEDVSLENTEDAETLRNLTATATSQEEIKIGREGLSNKILAQASEFTKAYGITLQDIIIRQIRYSDDLTESVYTRMIKERNQIAEAYRSYGRGQLAQWQGKTENDKKAILSEAYAKAEKIKGDADAQASRIYSQAYEADPEFFSFYRTLESYKTSLVGIDKIFSTDMSYFDQLYAGSNK